LRDTLGYAAIFLLVAAVGLPLVREEGDLTWKTLGKTVCFFTAAAVLARWCVIAFKARQHLTAPGQKIVGIEVPAPESVLEVVKPQSLKREDKKPKLKRFKRL